MKKIQQLVETENTGEGITAGLWFLRKRKVGSCAHVEGLVFEEGVLLPTVKANGEDRKGFGELMTGRQKQQPQPRTGRA